MEKVRNPNQFNKDWELTITWEVRGVKKRKFELRNRAAERETIIFILRNKRYKPKRRRKTSFNHCGAL